MKCAEALEWISVYSDMPEDDPQRLSIQSHLSVCEGCAEEYLIWAASEAWTDDLVESSLAEAEINGPITFDSSLVMDRIYSEQEWLMPVHRRSHVMSLKMRNILVGVMSFCIVVFMSSLIVMAVYPNKAETGPSDQSGIIPTAIAGSNSTELDITIGDVPYSETSEPLILQVVPTIPEYWIVYSLVGIIIASLLYHYLARMRR
ncbi:hypothetical protein [Paenibacillus assamensis]|uniref:hypothetical protein n=1 Tax=Paenibacillus assamensis TaxID=311244 RepID=UPI00040199B8|nr:hypothetical protein [Paenibacillus assamensis]